MDEQRRRLRGMREFVVVCQFLNFFHGSFVMPEFETRDFETALVEASEQPMNESLLQLHLRLLRSLMRNRGISPNNWLEVLQSLLVKRRFLEAEWTAARNFYGISELLGDDEDEVYEVPTLEGRSSDESNGAPGTRLSYHTIPLENKVRILHALCEWQLEMPETFLDLVKNHQAIKSDTELAWRLDPVGEDANGVMYWHFTDNRLYTQTFVSLSSSDEKEYKNGNEKMMDDAAKMEDTEEIEQEEEVWTLVADTSADWEAFANRFRTSKQKPERALHNYFKVVALNVSAELRAKEKEKEKQILLEESIANRKRSYRLQINELEKLEIQNLEFQELEPRRTRGYQDSGPQLSKEEREERARKEKAEARERRRLEREMRVQGLPEDQISLALGMTDTMSSIASVSMTTSSAAAEEMAKDSVEKPDDWFFNCSCGVSGFNIEDTSPMIECGECAVWQHIHCLPENKGRAAKKVKIDKWLKKDFVCQECLAKQKSPGADDEDFEMDEGGEESPDVAVEDETDSGESIQKRPRSRAGFSNGNASVPSGQPIKLVLRGNPPMITKGTLAQLEHTKDILRSRLLQLQQGVGPATGGVVLSSSAVIQGGTSSGPSSPARPLGPQQVPSPQQFQRIQQQALSSQQARALQKQAQSPHRMQPAQQHALQAQQVQTLHQQQQQYLMQQQALAMQIQQQQYANQIIALAMSNARASAQGSSLAQGTNPSSPAPTVVSPGSTPMSPAQIMALQMHAQQQQQQHQVQWQQMVQMQLLQQQQSTQAQQQRLHQEQVQSQMSGQQPMSTSDQIVAMPSTKPPPPQRSQTLMSLGPDSCQTEPGEDGVSSVAAKKRTLWADSSVEEEGDEEEDAPTVNTVHQPEEREGTVASGSPRLLDKTLQDLASL